MKGNSTTPEVADRPIPVALKVTHTAFVTALVPIYWRQYGPGTFLWFSDVALLTSVPALWLESSFIASTQAVGVLVPETLWLVDFSTGVLARRTPIGLASYMFDRRLSRFVRALSLFHLWLNACSVAHRGSARLRPPGPEVPDGVHVAHSSRVMATHSAVGFTTQAVRHLWEAARLRVGESDIEQMRFRVLSLREAIGRFTEAAYRRRLDFEHA